jgi:F0F1-type ATP synthase assembly protein I
MISQFAINILVPVFLCSFAGYWLDEKLGTSFLFIVFFFIGALAGGRNVFILARKIYDDKDTSPSRLYASNRKKKK